MSNSTTSKYMTLIVISTFLFIIFTSGCSSIVPVTHDALRRIPNPKSGNILVKSFIDNRKDVEPQEVGNLRNGYGMAIHSILIEEEPPLTTLMTEYFAEALEKAGYKTVLQSEQDTETMPTSSFDTVLEGEIKRLWIDGYWKYGCTIEVVLRALDSNSQNVIWEKEFVTEKDGAVITPALTDILNQAAQEFASDEFYRNAVKAGN